jgi:hypothetical protein
MLDAAKQRASDLVDAPIHSVVVELGKTRILRIDYVVIIVSVAAATALGDGRCCALNLTTHVR